MATTLALLIILAAALCAPARSSAQSLEGPPGFFGVSASTYKPTDGLQMAAADVGVTRNIFPLQVIKQGKRKPYYWGYTDPIVEMTAQAGIDLIPIVYGPPPWVSHDLNHTVLKGQSKKAWADFLRALVERYGPGGIYWQTHEYTPYRPITTWQIWNEPNSITWWGPRPAPKEYATVLLRSAAAIHEVDPGAQIMTAGIVARPTNKHAIPGKKYTSQLFKQRGVSEAVDILAYHPFAATVGGVRKQLKIARSTLKKRRAADTPIWITEIGWGSKGPSGLDLVKTPAGQKKVLSDTFKMVLQERERLGIGRLLWYQWRDGRDDLCLWCETSGLLDRKSKPKDLLGIFSSYATR